MRIVRAMLLRVLVVVGLAFLIVLLLPERPDGDTEP